jgi:hypothetical protein
MSDLSHSDLESLSPDRLLAEAAAAGLSVSVQDDRLLVRGPRGAEEVGRALLRRKAEVMPLLQTLAPPLAPVPSVPCDGWDTTRADAALAAIHARLDRAVAARGEANTLARRNVVDSVRRVVGEHHRTHDALLWTDLVETERRLGWWRNGYPWLPAPAGRR